MLSGPTDFRSNPLAKASITESLARTSRLLTGPSRNRPQKFTNRILWRSNQSEYAFPAIKSAQFRSPTPKDVTRRVHDRGIRLTWFVRKGNA